MECNVSFLCEPTTVIGVGLVLNTYYIGILIESKLKWKYHLKYVKMRPHKMIFVNYLLSDISNLEEIKKMNMHCLKTDIRSIMPRPQVIICLRSFGYLYNVNCFKSKLDIVSTRYCFVILLIVFLVIEFLLCTGSYIVNAFLYNKHSMFIGTMCDCLSYMLLFHYVSVGIHGHRMI